ncbi:MAG: ACT domain-containing protein, partial [Methanobacterium paludis]|nr:ACT domain-containing protein [Methanobacterium paludis]
DVRSKYYLRLTTIDQPGVLHTISGILSDYNISLESVNQKQTAKGEPVPIFMVTHGALEKHMAAAVERINKLDFVRGETVFIRLL